MDATKVRYKKIWTELISLSLGISYSWLSWCTDMDARLSREVRWKYRREGKTSHTIELKESSKKGTCNFWLPEILGNGRQIKIQFQLFGKIRWILKGGGVGVEEEEKKKNKMLIIVPRKTGKHYSFWPHNGLFNKENCILSFVYLKICLLGK